MFEVIATPDPMSSVARDRQSQRSVEDTISGLHLRSLHVRVASRIHVFR